MSVKERLRIFIKSQNLTVRAFEKLINVSNGYVSSIRSSIQPDKIERISEHFPTLSIDWLLTGKGEMLISDSDSLYKNGRELDEEDYHKALANGLHLIPEREAFFRGGEGGEVNFSSPIVAYWCIPQASKNGEVITVSGNSMAPRLPSGSRVSISPYYFSLNNPTGIEFGKIYAIVVEDPTTGEYRSFIKYLRRHPDRSLEKRYWIARSENREEYDDFEVEISQVRHLYVVEYAISRVD